MGTVTSQGVSAVSWTDECIVAGLFTDISDWVGALDHPFGVPLLDGVSVARPTDILVWLEESDTVLDRGSPRLAYPYVPHNRVRKMWRLSMFESDSPDFLDMGDPDLCFGMPASRDCVWDVE